MVLKIKCHHKRLKVILKPGLDEEICMDCGEVVRSRNVNEKLGYHYKKALIGNKVKFETFFWGGVHNYAARKRNSEE